MHVFATLALITLTQASAIWPPTEAPEAESPDVTIQTIDAEPLSGTIVGWTLQDELVLDDPSEDAPITVDSGQIVRITCEQAAEPLRQRNGPGKSRPSGRPFVVELIGGDHLSGSIADAAEDNLTIATSACGQVSIPLGHVAIIKSPAAASPRWKAVLGGLLRSGPAADDRLLLANGDVLRGFLRSIGATQVTIEQDETPLEVPLDHLVAALLVPTASAPATGLRARFTLTDGGRITATDLTWSRGSVELTAFGERSLNVPVDRIAQVDVAGGRWVWLSTLAPISEQHTPLLDLAWPPARDANVLGRPMRVAGQPYERGIGVHSASSMTYDLAGAYREFATSFGIDDDSGTFADVSVEIRVDSSSRYQKEHVRRGELHGPVRIDLRSANRIELIVGFGENGDVQDRFNWIEPGVVR